MVYLPHINTIRLMANGINDNFYVSGLIEIVEKFKIKFFMHVYIAYLGMLLTKSLTSASIPFQ